MVVERLEGSLCPCPLQIFSLWIKLPLRLPESNPLGSSQKQQSQKQHWQIQPSIDLSGPPPPPGPYATIFAAGTFDTNPNDFGQRVRQLDRKLLHGGQGHEL